VPSQEVDNLTLPPWTALCCHSPSVCATPTGTLDVPWNVYYRYCVLRNLIFYPVAPISPIDPIPVYRYVDVSRVCVYHFTVLPGTGSSHAHALPPRLEPCGAPEPPPLRCVQPGQRSAPRAALAAKFETHSHCNTKAFTWKRWCLPGAQQVGAQRLRQLGAKHPILQTAKGIPHFTYSVASVSTSWYHYPSPS
jgi:hypothetical protein